MRVTDINYLDLDEPNLRIRLTGDEAAYLVQLIGGFSSQTDPVAIKRNDPTVHAIGSEIYRCLTGEFFNRLYEDGVKDFLRGE